ncbi:MAG: UDP-2,4-diacetamido-2,4,6-trideoxy-beta-L-altropyranose hydrolase [Saprospiraceae bacterium]|nr:UDP-2,4-diacetamido-2,4,6-trideoxy-beta-L-altropyranose hydrolase [Saprospiraceae bacterium]
MENRPNLYLRADGNSRIGLGHLVRSLALAEMLSDIFSIHFITRNPLASLKREIKEICHSIILLPESIDHENEAVYLVNNHIEIGEAVVLDGYHFTTDYQTILKNWGCILICIDDIHAYHFVADAIINHAGGIKPEDYLCLSTTQLYLGLDYALLRKPFRDATKDRRPLENREDAVFICLGGADPQNHTLEVLKKCEKLLQGEKCYLILGAAYPYRNELEVYLKATSLDIEIRSNLNAEMMVHYMQRCKKAITPPSSISYEYMSISGELYVLLIADNQKRMLSYFTETGLAFDFARFGDVATPIVAEAIAKQQQLLDGNQQKRITGIFYRLLLKCKRASIDDLQLYLKWANDPLTRSQSFNQDPIPYESHRKWFLKKILNPDSILYLCLLGNTPIGQIRFELDDNRATINYSIDAQYRGRGLGSFVIQQGVVELLKEVSINPIIIGHVKKENQASRKCFINLGFEEQISTEFENSYQYTSHT